MIHLCVSASLFFDLVRPAPVLVPTRTAHAPTIDGRIDDAAWSDAAVATDLVQKFPAEGQSPSATTRVRVLYDEDAVYVGIECAQADVPIVARLTRRDRAVEADRVEVDLGSRGDGKSAFHFGVNAAGVLIDGLRYDDTELDLSWDENWEAAVQRGPDGWSAEIRIPLRLLRFPALPRQSWGFQVRRYISARQEIDEWAFIPRSVAGEVSRYGLLGPLDGLRGGGEVEVRPFVLARVRRRDASADTIGSGTDAALSAGLDGRWHITPDLTLDATVLPDFAQVEADQVVLNLTTYETFFPEKRPFFLEGLDTFALPVQLLYTRRIGRVPEAPDLKDGEALIDPPEPATIYGAAKLVGQIGGRFTLGALAAVTGRNDVLVQGADGLRSARPTDPPRAFGVLRLKRDLGDNAHVGLTATASASLGRTEPPDPGTLCAEQFALDASCFHDAYVAALDGRWRSPSGDYVLSGVALASLIGGGPPRQRLDGTLLSSGDAAPGVLLHAAKEGGSWLFDLTYEGYAPKVELDDLGYLTRANLHSFAGIGEYKDRTPGRWLFEQSFRLELFDRWNTDGLELAELYQINTSGKTLGFWEYFVELHYRAAHFDDREVGDGTALERAGLVGLEVDVSSDPRGRLVGSLNTQSQRLFDGWNFVLDAGLTLRALPQLDLEILPTASYTTGEPRFLGEADASGRPLFGNQQAKSIGATLRVTFTFAPRLTLQAYAQLFLASVHYDTFATAPTRTVHRSDLRPALAPAVNPDAEDAVVNANLVLRWEWRLGSTLYLVYTRAQSPAIGLGPGEKAQLDIGAALRGAAADVFLLKWSLWWA